MTRLVRVLISDEFFPALFIPSAPNQITRCVRGLPSDAVFRAFDRTSDGVITAWFSTTTAGVDHETVTVGYEQETVR